MNRYILTLFFALLMMHIQAQKKSPVLFTVGDEAVSKEQFIYIYEKNNSREDNFYSEESVREYLDLFIKFKLKVKEAKTQGLDTAGSFLEEFKTYREQLAKPYLTDNETREKLMKEAYERMQWEIRASHILIRINEDASPEESQKALDKINEVYEKAKSGEDFNQLAEEYSDDPSVKFNKGDLGYFTVFHLIYSFENVAYNTALGDISKPFRTQFGFHILKVTDKRPYQGQISTAQILVKADRNNISDTSAKIKIDKAWQELEKGKTWNNVVKEYSEDTRSKQMDGELPEFNSFSHNIPAEIKEVAFQLENDGDYSQPFQTNHGWIILKRIKVEGLKSYEEMQGFIKTKIDRDARSQLSSEIALEKIKKQFKFREKTKRLAIFNETLDSTFFKGEWKIQDPSVYNKWLIKIGDEVYTQFDFAHFIEDNQKKFRFQSKEYGINKLYEEFVKSTVLNYYDIKLEELYPEFRNLVNEYREGMLLFEITDKMVWNKAMEDSAGQAEFHAMNKDKYMWKERAKAVIYICRNQEICDRIIQLLEKDPSLSPDSIAMIMNAENPLNLSYSKGLFEKGENAYLDPYFDKKGTHLLYDDKKDQLRLIHIQDLYPPEYKKIEEVRGLVIADYQNKLEKDWIAELEMKYPVNVNEDVLNSIFTKQGK
jgi:peptidyl-prolyl cis-trans isomerase SurA